MKQCLLAAAAALVVVFGLWIVAVPEDLLINAAERALEEYALSLEASGLEKGLLFTFSSRSVKLKRNDEVLLSIDNLSARVSPLSLIIMKLPLSFKGDMSGGGVNGSVDLLQWKDTAEVVVTDARIEGMPLFAALGLSGNGRFSGTFAARRGDGRLRFSVEQTELSSLPAGGFAIPFPAFHTVRGVITFQGNTARIATLRMEGEGISARMRGDITNGAADVTVEVMYSPKYKDMHSVLEKYRVSPGYSVLPLRCMLPLKR